MEALKMDAFTEYAFLSALRCGPEGGVAFVAAKADVEENGYQRDLWVKPQEGEAFQLTTDGKTGGFLWDGPHTLLFQSGRDPQGKKAQEAGEEYTAFYRLDVRGGEAQKAFSVPLSASLVDKVGEGVYLLSVNWDLRFSKAYAMKGAAKEALLQEKKEERDYQVLDELPFYFNGAGYVNKHRTALFLLEESTGKLTRITRETFSVGGAHLSADGKKILYTGQAFTVKRKEKSGVYVYDLETGSTTELLKPRVYSLYDAAWWGDKILLLGTDSKRYGINENAQFYTLDPETREVSLFAPYEQAVGSSVGSDCRLGGGRDLIAQDGKYYFVATIRNASHVYCLEQTGEIRPVTLRDEYGPLNVWMMPFLRPADVRHFFPEEKIGNYNDAIRTVIGNIPLDEKQRNLMVAHQFVTGAYRSDSEDITVGGLDNIDGALFAPFDYTALGHIHSPQKITGAEARYCGSPLKYSFSEAGQQKSVLLVDLRGKGDLEIREILPQRVGDFNQSLMELGAMVCLPGGPPKCLVCPLRGLCRGYAQGVAEELPVKTKPKPRKKQARTLFLLFSQEGRVALRRRPEQGLLAGLWELPGTEGALSREEAAAWLAAQGVPVGELSPGPEAKHVFSHVEWHMGSWVAQNVEEVPGFVWVTREELRREYALPSAFKAFFPAMGL